MKFFSISILFFSILSLGKVEAQNHQTENIVFITLDGLRWQELFKGADSLLINDTGMIESPNSLLAEFWSEDPVKRREMLFPFFWSTIAKEGQIYGNRAYGNLVDTKNKMWFSYPGYNELLSGFADDTRITSNDKINNPNVTFLEYLNRMPAFQGKVLAFGSWDVFPYIINAERSGIPVNAGFAKAEGTQLSEKEVLLNRLQEEVRGPWEEVRLDPFTHHFAMEALKHKKPKVLYIAYGETDDWAHGNHYDQYLWSAKQTDAYIKEIWEYLQSDEQYKNKTTVIISVDHGRGITKTSWKGHGASVPEAGQTWIMALGPDTPASGEMKMTGQWHSAMLARTVFEFLDLEYPDQKAGVSIKEMIK